MHHVEQPPLQAVREQGVAPVEHVAKDALLAVQRSGHAVVLRALPGEQEADPRVLAIHRRQARGTRSARRFEFADQFRHAVADHRAAGCEMRPTHGGDAADRRQRRRILAQPGAERCGQPRERRRRAGGERQDLHRPACRRRPACPPACLHACPGACGRAMRRLLEHDMRIGAAEAERAHPGAPGPPAIRPCLSGSRDRNRDIPQPQAGIGLPEVRQGRDPSCLQREDRLDQPGHARRCLRMADTRLRRADQQLLPRRAAGAVDCGQRRHLDRVAERGAGAVRLHVVHLVRGDACIREGSRQHRLLRAPAGRGQPVAAAILVHRRAADHRVDRIAVRQRVGEALEHHDAAAFAAHIAAGGGVEAAAPAVRRQHPGPREGDAQRRRQHQVHAAGQCQPGLAGTQAGASQMDRHQRGGAGGIQGQCRTLGAVEIGQPPRGHRGRVAGRVVGVQIQVRRPRQQPLLVIVPEQPDEDPGRAAGERVRRDPRLFQRLVAGLQQQALLRIGQPGLARRHVEERGIERLHPIEKAAGAADHAAGATGPRIVQRRRIPAAARHLGDRVDTIAQQVPVALRRAGATRKPAGHADHGDRVRRDVACRSLGGGGGERIRILGSRPRSLVAAQEGGELRGRRMAEEDRRIECATGAPAQQHAQFQQIQRIQSDLAEWPVRPILFPLAERAHALMHRCQRVGHRQAGHRRLAVHRPVDGRADSRAVVVVIGDEHAGAPVVGVGGAEIRHHRHDPGAMPDMELQDRIDRHSRRIPQRHVRLDRLRAARHVIPAARDPGHRRNAGHRAIQDDGEVEQPVAEALVLHLRQHVHSEQLHDRTMIDAKAVQLLHAHLPQCIDAGDTLRIDGTDHMAASLGHAVQQGMRSQPPPQCALVGAQRLRPARRLERQQRRQVAGPRRTHPPRRGHEMVQRDPGERQGPRVAPRGMPPRQHARFRRCEQEGVCGHQVLVREGMIGIEMQVLAGIQVVAHHPGRQRMHLQRHEAVRPGGGGPTLHMLDQALHRVAARDRRTVRRHRNQVVRQIPACAGRGAVDRFTEQPVMIQEGAHMQHRSGRSGAVRRERRAQRLGIADIDRQAEMRDIAQRARGDLERLHVEVRAHHHQRARRQRSSAPRAIAHRHVQHAQERAVAAAAIDNEAGLPRQLRIVEQRDHRLLQIHEVALMLKAARDHVQGAVQVPFAPRHVAIQQRAVARQDGVETCQQRRIRRGRPGDHRAFGNEAPGLRQFRGRAMDPALRGKHPAHRIGQFRRRAAQPACEQTMPQHRIEHWQQDGAVEHPGQQDGRAVPPRLQRIRVPRERCRVLGERACHGERVQRQDVVRDVDIGAGGGQKPKAIIGTGHPAQALEQSRRGLQMAAAERRRRVRRRVQQAGTAAGDDHWNGNETMHEPVDHVEQDVAPLSCLTRPAQASCSAAGPAPRPSLRLPPCASSKAACRSRGS